MMSETALKYEKCHFKQNYNLKLFSLLFYNINYRSGGNQSKGKNLNLDTSPKKSSMDYFTNKQKACFIIRPIIFKGQLMANDFICFFPIKYTTTILNIANDWNWQSLWQQQNLTNFSPNIQTSDKTDQFSNQNRKKRKTIFCVCKIQKKSNDVREKLGK